MIGMHAEVKKLFFSEAKVKRALDRKTRYVLNKSGGMVRKYAQYSMRDSKRKRSLPGEPPRARKSKRLKRMLYYAFSPSKKSVVIGPVLWADSKLRGLPSIMEKGGNVTKQEKDKNILVKYDSRPYMGPAMTANMDTIASLYKAKGLA